MIRQQNAFALVILFLTAGIFLAACSSEGPRALGSNPTHKVADIESRLPPTVTELDPLTLALQNGRDAIEIAQNGLLEWVPSGGLERPVTPECLPSQLEEKLSQKGLTEDQYGELAREYFSQCGKMLSKHHSSAVKSLIKVGTVQYKVYDRSEVEPIRLKFISGEYLDGFLAIKNDGVKRPFIVVKCGLFCEGDPSGSTRMILMHLFDESPFNVIILGNLTGRNNLKINRRLVFGGFYEGQEVLAVSQWLRYNSPFKELISSLHVVGISLGGNAALFSSLYNSHAGASLHENLIQSVVAYCPVVNMKRTVRYLFESAFTRLVVSKVTWDYISELYDQIPDLADEFDSEVKPEAHEYPDRLGRTATHFLHQVDPSRFLAPFRYQSVSDLKTFWSLNEFSNFAAQTSTPTLIWASKDDIVVKNEFNAGRFETLTSQPSRGSVHLLNIEHGSHCGPSVSYGWPTASAIFRSFFLQHSPQLKEQKYQSTIDLKLPLPPFDSSDIHLYQTWMAHPGQRNFTVEFRTWSPFDAEYNCEFATSLDSPLHCTDKYELSVPFSIFPKEFETPQNAAEAQALSRWANSHIEFKAQGQPIEQSTHRPDSLRVTYFQ